MPKVIAYSFNADYHCFNCTMKYARAVPYSEYDWQGKYSDEDIMSTFQPGIFRMTTAIELEIIKDSENNPLHPLFNTDEWWDYSIEGKQTLSCGDCGIELDTVNDDD